MSFLNIILFWVVLGDFTLLSINNIRQICLFSVFKFDLCTNVPMECAVCRRKNTALDIFINNNRKNLRLDHPVVGLAAAEYNYHIVVVVASKRVPRWCCGNPVQWTGVSTPTT